ncbi:SDR family oxidoreductase [Anaerolineae bacterium CFX7]|nr:SDR family oxidoreductase [Anaerolineae bacterium CFX7]
MATYLVTGGAGFIGSHIVQELVRQGEIVRVFDNFSTGCRQNLSGLLDALDLIEGDIRDLALVQAAAQGVEYILHQAALPSVPRSIADPITTHQVNVTGTLNVLMAARQANVRRVVYASSSSVYGNSPTLPKREEMPTNPLSPYAVSKLAGENYCRAFYQVYGLPIVALRYFNVFGPHQDPASQYAAVIPKFITAMLRGDRPLIHGDGLQSRDFTYVANVVQANLLACQAEAAVGQVCNAALGGRVSLLELVSRLNQILGKELEPLFDDARTGDVKHSQADVSKLRALTGFVPVTDLQTGLAKTVEWYAQQV